MGYIYRMGSRTKRQELIRLFYLFNYVYATVNLTPINPFMVCNKMKPFLTVKVTSLYTKGHLLTNTTILLLLLFLVGVSFPFSYYCTAGHFTDLGTLR